MELVKSIFGTNLYDLTIENIIFFFKNPQVENSKLEFKSGNVEIEKIYSEVTAFLNTEGGVIIIGAPEEIVLEGYSEKVCIGNLKPSTKIKNIDILLSGIAGNISPTPTGIKVKDIDYQSGKIFIIEIPQSNYAPHQDNRQGKYFIRLERDCKPAPHGLVEALFFKRQKPKLNANIGSIRYVDNDNYFIKFKIDNESHYTAEALLYQIQVYGVKELIDSKNLKNYELDGNILKSQFFDRDMLLVKGLGIDISLEVILEKEIVICFITFFCKDIAAQYKVVVFENGEVRAVYDSKTDTDEGLELFIDTWIGKLNSSI